MRYGDVSNQAPGDQGLPCDESQYHPFESLKQADEYAIDVEAVKIHAVPALKKIQKAQQEQGQTNCQKHRLILQIEGPFRMQRECSSLRITTIFTRQSLLQAAGRTVVEEIQFHAL
jgi:hypothetical protein